MDMHIAQDLPLTGIDRQALPPAEAAALEAGRTAAVLAGGVDRCFPASNRKLAEAIAERGESEGCLAWPPTEMPPPIGYICALKDPDGNVIEFSYDQGVYAKAQEVWGAGA